MATRVLVTGAAGRVARLMLPGLAFRYRLHLTDLVPLAVDADLPAATIRTGDLTDPDFAEAVTAGVDAVVHLAGNPDPAAPLNDLVNPNVRATATLLDAAAANGVSKVVLASSLHVMGQYAHARKFFIEPGWPTAPCCAYGVTKGFVESLARMHSYRRPDSSILCLRLGATVHAPPTSAALGSWLSPGDLQHLVECALEARVRFGVYHGVSANTQQQWEIGNAQRELGYQPTYDSEKYALEVPISVDWGPCPPGA